MDATHWIHGKLPVFEKRGKVHMYAYIIVRCITNYRHYDYVDFNAGNPRWVSSRKGATRFVTRAHAACCLEVHDQLSVGVPYRERILKTLVDT